MSTKLNLSKLPRKLIVQRKMASMG